MLVGLLHTMAKSFVMGIAIGNSYHPSGIFYVGNLHALEYAAYQLFFSVSAVLNYTSWNAHDSTFL